MSSHLNREELRLVQCQVIARLLNIITSNKSKTNQKQSHREKRVVASFATDVQRISDAPLYVSDFQQLKFP